MPVDPATKALVETAAEIFTAPERQRLALIETELRAAWQAISDCEPRAVNERLRLAKTGCAPGGEYLPAQEQRLANLREAQAFADERELREHDARTIEARCFANFKSPARLLVETTVERLAAVLANPPKIKLPEALAAWGIDVDLAAIFAATIHKVKSDLGHELAQWGRSEPVNAYHLLARAEALQKK